MESTLDAFRRGIQLFDEQRFFEAHECFEFVWNAADTESKDRRFWKGVIQVAVGCCHAQRGNARGALALLERAAGYLQGYPSPHCGVDTAALLSIARGVADQVREWGAADEVRARGASGDLEFPKFPAMSL